MRTVLRFGSWQAVFTLLSVAAVSAQGTPQYLAQFDGDRGEPRAGVIQGPGGMLYGTTGRGGYGYGSVFRFDPATSTLTTIYAFTGGLDGGRSVSRLLLASDGNFYGTTTQGGANGWGTIFKLTPAGTLTTVHSFPAPTGEDWDWSLIEATDGNFYGTTAYGGANERGSVYRLTPSGTFSVVASFDDSTQFPSRGLVQGSDGALYGAGLTSIYRVNLTTGTIAPLATFAYPCPNGCLPSGPLVRGPGGVLFGATRTGGLNGSGTVFKITEGGALTTIASMPAGSAANGDVTLGSDGYLYVLDTLGRRIFRIALNGTTDVIGMLDTVTSDPFSLTGSLVQTSSFTFYGTIATGGTNNEGAIFRLVTAVPEVTILNSFGSAGPANPISLTTSSAGGFHGIALTQGGNAYATVFALSTGGALSTVHAFQYSDPDLTPQPSLFNRVDVGAYGVVEGNDGSLFGVTWNALSAPSSFFPGSGALFKLAPDGTPTTLFAVTGATPSRSPILASDGNLYGIVLPHHSGLFSTMFKVAADGTFLSSVSFTTMSPEGSLVQGQDGNLYGVMRSSGIGGVFKVTLAGELTTLASFPDASATPFGPLVAASDGNLYGRTRGDGPGGIGSVFKVTPAGVLTTVAFVNGNSRFVDPQLTEGPGGNLYGTTVDSIFRVTAGGVLTTLRSFSLAEGAGLGPLIVTGPRELYVVANTGGPVGGGAVIHLTDVAPVLTSGYTAASPLVTPQNTIASGAVTATDVDDSASTFIFRVVAQGTKGTAVIDPATGAFTYTPAPNARGRDAFTVTVSDPFDDSNVVAVFVIITPLPPAARDFDADGRSDMTLYQGDGRWRILKSSNAYVSSTVIDWGGAGYVPVAGDYDGDGSMDPAVYESATGRWLALLSGTNFTTVLGVNWGGTGYMPAPGDYDSDGKTDPSVYVRATGQWLTLRSSDGYTTSIIRAAGRGTPVPDLDFDGDGASDIAVVHGSIWSILTSSTAFANAVDVTLGGAAVTLVGGDYDGDGKADPAVYERSTGHWRILQSSTSAILDLVSGGVGFDPVPGDYDGDGILDPAVVERATGTWTALLSTTGFSTTLTVTGWGASTDTLISSAIPIIVSDTTRASDADGDGGADMTVYNTVSGQWRTQTSASGFSASFTTSWGGAGYTAVPGDYDGDGKADRALYQEASGKWFVLLSGANFTTSLGASAGGPGYVPVAADYDGDGKTDFAVYDTTSGLWYILKSSANSTTAVAISWGGADYTPVPADFDGDGRADLALYVPATGSWHVLLSSTNFTTSLSQSAGGTGWLPVPGDYDGDGKADFVVYNTSTGQWYGLASGSAYTATINTGWGGTGYTPGRGDFDADGRLDLALYQPANGTWYVLLSSSNFMTSLIRTWGEPGDIPVQP